MTIEIDSNSGFCFGVTGAIRKAEEELNKGPLSCLGDIVHNGQEVSRLERLGLTTITYEDLKKQQGGRVLLRAHGEPPLTYATAQQNGIQIIDATCPVVKKLQERIRQTYLQHPEAQIVIFGKVGHAEVIGLQGQTDNTALVVESVQDLTQIDYERDIYLFSQTTKSVEEFHALVAHIRQHAHAAFEYHDTICRNVANRGEQIQAFARRHDLIIFVGGEKSSNAKVLYEQCLQANPNTVFIASPDELTPKRLPQLTDDMQVGICGATSTPLWLMEQVKAALTDNQ